MEGGPSQVAGSLGLFCFHPFCVHISSMSHLHDAEKQRLQREWKSQSRSMLRLNLEWPRIPCSYTPCALRRALWRAVKRSAVPVLDPWGRRLSSGWGRCPVFEADSFPVWSQGLSPWVLSLPPGQPDLSVSPHWSPVWLYNLGICQGQPEGCHIPAWSQDHRLPASQQDTSSSGGGLRHLALWCWDLKRAQGLKTLALNLLWPRSLLSTW